MKPFKFKSTWRFRFCYWQVVSTDQMCYTDVPRIRRGWIPNCPCKHDQRNTTMPTYTPVWLSSKELKYIAAVPDNWLLRFAATHPGDIRKLGESSNSKLLYRVSAVLEAIEGNECVRPRCADTTAKAS